MSQAVCKPSMTRQPDQVGTLEKVSAQFPRGRLPYLANLYHYQQGLAHKRPYSHHDNANDYRIIGPVFKVFY